MSECCREAWSSARITSRFGRISVGCCGIFKPSRNCEWNYDAYTRFRGHKPIQVMETQWFPVSKQVQGTDVIRDKDGNLLVDYLENVQPSWQCRLTEDRLKLQLVSKRKYFISSKRPLRTRNSQICTLKFWNGRPAHLTWPCRTTLFTNLKGRKQSSIKEATFNNGRAVCSETKIMFLGWVKEVRTTESECGQLREQCVRVNA